MIHVGETSMWGETFKNQPATLLETIIPGTFEYDYPFPEVEHMGVS